MIHAEQRDGDVSLFALGTTLLQHRWRIFRWMLLGAGAVGGWVATRPATYVAAASFIPQGTDASRSGLASLAGQFGVSLPSGSPSLSPELYLKILSSRVLLARVVRDTLTVPELQSRKVAVLDLLEVKKAAPAIREERGIIQLRDIVRTSVVKSTGVVDISVETEWPSVSLAIAAALIDGVNAFNQRTNQGQASAERRFVQGRLTQAATELRAAEDRLEDFLARNRLFTGSPDLVFQRDRLEREVTSKQQVVNTLTQSYQEASIREVRDMPTITMVELPSLPLLPQPRGRAKALLLGSLLGGLIGALLVLMSAMILRRRMAGNAEADEFVGTLGEVLRPVRTIAARFRGRVREVAKSPSTNGR